MDDTTTQLLTLLNVSALKRKRPIIETVESLKLNKRKKTVPLLDQDVPSQTPLQQDGEQVTPGQSDNNGDELHSGAPEVEGENEDSEAQTPYKFHFGPEQTLLSEPICEDVDQGKWKKSILRHGKLGAVSLSMPESSGTVTPVTQVSIREKLRSAYDARGAQLSADQSELRSDILSSLSYYRDLFVTRVELDQRSILRDAVTLHALNHVFSIRRRILKNNDRLSQASKGSSTTPSDVQDQGFTRPSVLILLPFRSSALYWAEALLAQLPSHQVENHSRLISEFSLPPGTVDKLATADWGTYPQDHVETFKGNVDDNFRVGVKLTKKSVKIFADFYRCDVIIASPLGLRMSIEKEKSSDFLSSIEVLIMDQMDALTMQNWEHVQFILGRLNQLPKDSHDADFSRIKPWYLDGHAAYLRQSILLSPYETPEMRSLFSRSLKNVAGKLRTERKWKPVAVPEGVEQTLTKFHCISPKSEADKRFEFFTTQSAVQSTNTIIFVPSSFDFIRVQNHLRKMSDVSLAILSEYSSNQDISRARQSFFSGKKRFLLMSERFHFFRRYRIRGVRNIVFYGLPEHPQFYTELLSYPFLDDGVDSSDITCCALYCKYDYMRLERITGSEAAGSLMQAS
ncbi:digestive organ expansion factor [Gautieria morchelliformis]|nr:digestive organ expansion factor [Gautieria morchelliformis]